MPINTLYILVYTILCLLSLIGLLLAYWEWGPNIKSPLTKGAIEVMKEVGIILFHFIGSIILPILLSVIIIELVYAFLASLI